MWGTSGDAYGERRCVTAALRRADRVSVAPRKRRIKSPRIQDLMVINSHDNHRSVDVADVFNTNRAIAERIACNQTKMHVSGYGGKVWAASALLSAID